MDTIETGIYTAFLTGSVVIGALLLYFAVKMYRNHRKYFVFMSNFYLNEVELQEQERNRIARDLHDELGPLVSIAYLLIQNSEGATEEDRTYLSKAEQSLLELSERFRAIAQNLAPDVLQVRGLPQSIDLFLQRCRAVSMIAFSFQSKLQQELPERFGLQVYRLVQELVHNAIKHSEAQKVTLQLVERKKMLYLFYTDDGKGIAAEQQQLGMGLKSMRNRVTMLRGEMTIDSKPRSGTRIYFSLPIHTDYA